MPTLTARLVDVPPDPLLLGGVVASRPGAALLWSADGAGPSYVACHPVTATNGFDPEPALEAGYGSIQILNGVTLSVERDPGRTRVRRRSSLGRGTVRRRNPTFGSALQDLMWALRPPVAAGL